MDRTTDINGKDIRDENRNPMPALRIGIVEDEIIIAENIAANLRQLGYDVLEPANTYIEAVSMLIKKKPDLVILDIMLNDDRDGIQLATRINKEFHIPFIYLTANADMSTIDRAKHTEPAAYLIKPFTKNDLYASIEIAATRHKLQGGNQNLEEAIFVKDGSTMRKLQKHDILRIEADRVYVNVHTRYRSYLLRRSIAQMLDELNDPRFVQIHRSHVVNVNHVDEMKKDEITLQGIQLPVSKGNRQKLQELFEKRI
jgi:DNA-binding LytR/AlgR family response regulator